MRLKNKELLKTYKEKPCLVCGSLNQVSAHHIKTRGAGGDDSEWNLMPLCFNHHTEIHKTGLRIFANKYSLNSWLISKGWEFEGFTNKWKFYLHSSQGRS